MLPVALSIAGSDPSGGAGVQADLKAFHQHGVYGAAVISLLTVQNTLGCQRVEVIASELVEAQLKAVLEDLPVRVLKTGALGSVENVRVVARAAAASGLPLVVDPVRLASHVVAPQKGQREGQREGQRDAQGSESTETPQRGALLPDQARDVLISELLPHVTLLTPNLSEAAWLLGRPVTTLSEARAAAQALIDLGAQAVLLKGGHLEGPATDVLACDGSLHEIAATRVVTQAGHGTGCSLASAIAARLARGEALHEAVIQAKAWVHAALLEATPLGHGAWPIHAFATPPKSNEDH